jgi:hypothetical protein
VGRSMAACRASLGREAGCATSTALPDEELPAEESNWHANYAADGAPRCRHLHGNFPARNRLALSNECHLRASVGIWMALRLQRRCGHPCSWLAMFIANALEA